MRRKLSSPIEIRENEIKEWKEVRIVRKSTFGTVVR